MTDEIRNNRITAAQIQATTITASSIAANAVTPEAIAATEITSNSILDDPHCLFTQDDIDNAPDVETEDPEEED